MNINDVSITIIKTNYSWITWILKKPRQVFVIFIGNKLQSLAIHWQKGFTVPLNELYSGIIICVPQRLLWKRALCVPWLIGIGTLFPPPHRLPAEIGSWTAAAAWWRQRTAYRQRQQPAIRSLGNTTAKRPTGEWATRVRVWTKKNLIYTDTIDAMQSKCCDERWDEQRLPAARQTSNATAMGSRKAL